MTPVPISQANTDTLHNCTTEQQEMQKLSKPNQKKEELARLSKPASQMKPASSLSKQAKAPRRSSRPIINWFQRKLAGTVKVKRAENVPQQGKEAGRRDGRGRILIPARVGSRVASSPLPSSQTGGRQQTKLDATTRRKTVSLNGDDDGRDYSLNVDDEEIVSLGRSSTWSPHSVLEADEDASVRPIPPSVPPSPSPSRSSSSYLSDPRTFRSMAASTKPTTLLSIDLNGGGMAHIAQVPASPNPQINRFSHVRTGSSPTTAASGTGTSITFSPLPVSSQTSSRPSSLQISSQPSGSHNVFITTVQAPQHTAHHPRNNPRPSSPPLDNASVLTIASSSYMIPGLRPVIGTSAPPSAFSGGDSVSHFGGSIVYPDVESTSQFVLGDDDRLEERDVDASVRALRPRSSRRGSWESEASRWSARVQATSGTPSVARDRSLWTANSVHTGALSTDNVDVDERSDDLDGRDATSVAEESAPDTQPSLTPNQTGIETPTSVVVVQPTSGLTLEQSVSPIPVTCSNGQPQISAGTHEQLIPQDGRQSRKEIADSMQEPEMRKAPAIPDPAPGTGDTSDV